MKLDEIVTEEELVKAMSNQKWVGFPYPKRHLLAEVLLKCCAIKNPGPGLQVAKDLGLVNEDRTLTVRGNEYMYQYFLLGRPRIENSITVYDIDGNILATVPDKNGSTHQDRINAIEKVGIRYWHHYSFNNRTLGCAKDFFIDDIDFKDPIQEKIARCFFGRVPEDGKLYTVIETEDKEKKLVPYETEGKKYIESLITQLKKSENE